MSSQNAPAEPAPVVEPPPPPAPAEPFDWTPVWLVVGISVALLVVAFVVVVAYGIVTARREDRRQAQELRDARQQRWSRAIAAWQNLGVEITAFETDPESVFTRPLLGDLKEPATQQFWEKWGAADALHLESFPSSDEQVAEFTQAVTAARLAFDAADTNARDKARRHITSQNHKLTPSERRNVARARKLLRLVLDPAASPHEATQAEERMRALLDGILVIPAAVARSLSAQINQKTTAAITA